MIPGNTFFLNIKLITIIKLQDIIFEILTNLGTIKTYSQPIQVDTK